MTADALITAAADLADPFSDAKTARVLSGRRVLFVMPSIPLQGMERATLQIMRMLVENGAEVLCLTERVYGRPVAAEVERVGGHCLPIDCQSTLQLTRRPAAALRTIWQWTRFSLALRRIIRTHRPTHIHVSNFTFFQYALPVLWRCGLPVVFRLSNPPDCNLSGRKQALSNWIWRRCVSRVCDAVVCNSQFAMAELRKTGARCGRVELIHNCLPQRPAVDSRDIPHLPADRFKIVYVGRIQPKKGCDLLIDAILRMLQEGRPVELVLAGEYAWHNPFAEGLIDRVRSSGWDKHIRFLGEIQDVFGLFDACDVHVHPSLTEAFSNAVLEAKSRGVPSVAFSCTSLPEQISHLEDGYLCTEISSEALYESLCYFMDHPDQLRAAGQAARQSLARYSAERAAQAWVELYQSL
jgi:glycosyltransferase involved in cell wall biosynthesis